MKHFLGLLVLLSSFSLYASDGHDTGGGGIGVPAGNRIYLYDFVEGGVEASAYVNTEIPDEMRMLSDVQRALGEDIPTAALVTAKFNEIFQLSPDLARPLADFLRDYHWRFVNVALIPTRDIGRTPIAGRLERRQIAFRDDSLNTVTIDRDYWALMPVTHRAGLVFHEIIYALTGAPDSARTRNLVAYLFDPRFSAATLEELRRRVALTLPAQYASLRGYAQVTDIESPAFQSRCQAFRQEVQAHIQPNLVLQGRVATEIRATLWSQRCMSTEYNYDGQTIYYSFQRFPARDNIYPVIYQRRSYSVPDRNILPTRLMCDHRAAYNMPPADQRALEAGRARAAQLVETHNSTFYGACLNSEDAAFINRIARLVIFAP